MPLQNSVLQEDAGWSRGVFSRFFTLGSGLNRADWHDLCASIFAKSQSDLEESPYMKKSKTNQNQGTSDKCPFLRAKIALVAFSALGVVCLQPGGRAEASAFSSHDERNRLAEYEDADSYNAGAYQKINAEIEKSISNDPSISSHAQVNSDFRDGTLVLTGEVDSPAVMKKILEISQESAGMAHLENRIEIKAVE